MMICDGKILFMEKEIKREPETLKLRNILIKRTEISWLVGEIELIFPIRTAELKSYKLKY